MSSEIKKKYDVVIIGAGPAGLAAAEGAVHGGAKNILLIDRHKWLGGILQQCIHPGFGLQIFKSELTGPEYAQKFIDKIKNFNIKFLNDTTVLNIINPNKLLLTNKIFGLKEIDVDSIVLATGCRERTRGNLNIPGFRPAGIFTAGTAQRLINIDGLKIGKKVVILGSGDIGLIMARRCKIEGLNVLAVLEILPYSSGLIRNVVQCLNDFKIPLYLKTIVTFIDGKNRLKGVKIAKLDNYDQIIPGSEDFINCDTLLLSVGLIPEIELLRENRITEDPLTWGPVVDDFMQTSIKGIFACGNAIQVYDLVDYVSRDSYLAGKNAAIYSLFGIKEPKKIVKLKPGEGVKYVVPQLIKDIEGLKSTNKFIYLRVKKHSENSKFIFSSKGKIIFEKRSSYVTPSEMISIDISKFRNNFFENNEIEIKLKTEDG